MKTLRFVLALLPTVFAAMPAAAQTGAPFDVRAHYTKRVAMIPMRDGVRLYTSILVPNDTTAAHPIVMTRTPYGCPVYGDTLPPRRLNYIESRYAEENFILVCQDVRGRWMSEGDFVDTRPVIENPGPGQTDETTDSYDTIDWLIHNVAHNNGRVGTRGTSYPGGYAELSAIHAHPALKVVSPQAPVTEWMGGDDFFHHGALLEPHLLDFENFFGRARPAPTSERPTELFEHGTPDGYAFYRRLGALTNVNRRLFHDSVAFWDTVVAHPMWDAYWAAHSGIPHLHNLTPAMLWVGGWFDTENLWGALHAYQAAEAGNPGITNRLVMGPWFHGQWNTPTGDSLGVIAWGQATARFYADSIEVPFFNYYLLDNQPPPRAFEAAVFDTGRKQWTFADHWPIAGGAETNLYLGAGGTVTTTPPAVHGRSFDQYVSDPAKPVPYTAQISNWYNHAFMIEDQRFADRRPDVLVYESAPLEHDMTVAGPIDVDLWVSTSGTDADFAVKVIDVFPDTLGNPGGRGFSAGAPVPLGGYEMPVRMDLMRGKYRGHPDHPMSPRPFTPNAPTQVGFDMNDVYHTFQRGHRIMIQVQSTMFPMFDRNPGRFMDIFAAHDGDFRATTERVFHSAEYPSHVVLRVVP